MNYDYTIGVGDPPVIRMSVQDDSIQMRAAEIPVRVPQIEKTTEILKGDNDGNAVAAEAGVDYQAPLEAGVDYQTPLVAGTDYQTPLPSQSGKNGKYLKTDGSAMSWEDAPAAPVTSVNNKTGAVTLGAADVGALPDSYTAPVTSVNSNTGDVVITAADLGAYEKPAGGIPAADLADNYAASHSAGGAAELTVAIPYGEIDSTSTSTVLTATVPGIWQLKDGVCCYVRNDIVTSATNCTLNINGLGAKPMYISSADASRVTSGFSAAQTWLFVYNEKRVDGGCWDQYQGQVNSNTIGYQLRTNSLTLPLTDKCYRYRLLFTSANGTKLVPANADTQTSAAKTHTTCTTPIDPFGEIFYYGSTTVKNANESPGATTIWQQYVVTLGYSFNNANAALALTSWKPVYITATPQSDGSAVLDYFTQDRPTTNDGKIYIFLGIAVSATTVEMTMKHPIYYHDGTRCRLYTGA